MERVLLFCQSWWAVSVEATVRPLILRSLIRVVSIDEEPVDPARYSPTHHRSNERDPPPVTNQTTIRATAGRVSNRQLERVQLLIQHSAQNECQQTWCVYMHTQTLLSLFHYMHNKCGYLSQELTKLQLT